MSRGRKRLKQAASEQDFTLKECQSIVQAVSLRGSNQIKIMDAKRDNSLALFPESLCIRRGTFLASYFDSSFTLVQTVETKIKSSLFATLYFGLAVTQQKSRRDMCEIPRDLMIEVFMRLPAKSLMKFKCISKHWSSLISSRYFCNRVFTVARQQQPRLYMCLVDQFGQRELLSLSMSSTSPDNTCFVVDQDLSSPGMGGFFLSIVHDLMCFYVTTNACIYNPNTKQLLTLPAIKSDIIDEQGQRKDTRYPIGHDPVNDQYKLFCTIAISSRGLANLKSEHWVFVLEAGGLWKKVVPREHYHPHAPLSRGWFVSGSVVHYMAWLDMHICAVVSFEITSEELTIIPVPKKAGDVFLPAVMMMADIIEYGGKIAIFDHSYLDDEGLVDLWVLEDAGKKKWSKQTLVLQPCQRHLVHDTELKVKGTIRDGKVILAPSEMGSGFYIMYYDIQSNSLTRVKIEGVPHYWFDKICYFDLKFMDESESFIYLET
ncbi:F-box protein [Cardamine amara subsp. amara]|uniref:F-box protein n=1 Tax=Cardamine amara subsp. amara TaxID=228776 RepID=A0ABD1BSD1_CARAN